MGDDVKDAAKTLSALGASKGGKARAAKLSTEERSAIAKKAADARWNSIIPKATHAGSLQIGDLSIDCAVLEDGRRVLSEAAVMRALGKGYSGYYSQRDSAAGDKSAVLPRYLSPGNLKPFVSEELANLLTTPILYSTGVGRPAKGVEAKVLSQICEVWLKARAAGVLRPTQLHIAAKAEILVLGFAEVGITALVDEATGFQRDRERDALAKILEQFIAKELRKWVKTFPAEFYELMFKLKGWKMNPSLPNARPGAVAGYTNDIVYMRLAPGVLEELKRLTPRDENGRPKAKYHQSLSEDVGHPRLREHLTACITLMRVSKTWDGFMEMLDIAHPRIGDTRRLPMHLPTGAKPGP